MKFSEKIYIELREIDSYIVELILMPFKGMQVRHCDKFINTLVEKVKKLESKKAGILEEVDLLFQEDYETLKKSSCFNDFEMAFETLCNQFSDEPLTPELINDTKRFLSASEILVKKINTNKADVNLTISEFSLFYASVLYDIKNLIQAKVLIFDETDKFINKQSYPVLDSLDNFFESKLPIKLHRDTIAFVQKKPGHTFIKSLIRERDALTSKNNNLEHRIIFISWYNNYVILNVFNCIHLIIERVNSYSSLLKEDKWDIIKTFYYWLKEFLNRKYVPKFSHLFLEILGIRGNYIARIEDGIEEDYWKSLELGEFVKVNEKEHISIELELRVHFRTFKELEKGEEFERLVGQDYYSKSIEDFKENMVINKLNFGNAEYLKYLRDEKLRYTNILEYCLSYNIWEEYPEIKSIVNLVSTEMISFTRNINDNRTNEMADLTVEGKDDFKEEISKSSKKINSTNDDEEIYIEPYLLNLIIKAEQKAFGSLGTFDSKTRCAAFCEILYKKKYIKNTKTRIVTISLFAKQRYNLDIKIALGHGKNKIDDRNNHKNRTIRNLPPLEKCF